MPDGSTTPHFQFQAPRGRGHKGYPTGCFKKYAAWLNAEQMRDRSVFWLLFEINNYDPAEAPRPFMWEMRERARAIIEEREPWPEYLLPYKSMRQNTYFHSGRYDIPIPSWLDPDNWTDRQRSQSRFEKDARAAFLKARNNRYLFDNDRPEWRRRIRAAIANLEAVRQRSEDQKRHSFTRSARVPSISSLKRSALRGMRH